MWRRKVVVVIVHVFRPLHLNVRSATEVRRVFRLRCSGAVIATLRWSAVVIRVLLVVIWWRLVLLILRRWTASRNLVGPTGAVEGLAASLAASALREAAVNVSVWTVFSI